MFVWVFLFYPIPPNNLLQGLFRPYFPCFGLLGSIQGGLVLNLRDYRLHAELEKVLFFLALSLRYRKFLFLAARSHIDMFRWVNV